MREGEMEFERSARRRLTAVMQAEIHEATLLGLGDIDIVLQMQSSIERMGCVLDDDPLYPEDILGAGGS